MAAHSMLMSNLWALGPVSFRQDSEQANSDFFSVFLFLFPHGGGSGTGFKASISRHGKISFAHLSDPSDG